MKRFRQTPSLLMIFSALLMLLTVFAPDFCYARLKWKNIGPEGGEVSTLAIDPGNSNTIYAAIWGGGVFKSTNGGATWTPTNSGLTNGQVDVLAIDPSNSNIVYAGTYGGVFKSTNGGSTWTAMNSGLDNDDVTSLAIDPGNPNTVYAAILGYYGGVFKSTNGGGSWSAINSGLPKHSDLIWPS